MKNKIIVSLLDLLVVVLTQAQTWKDAYSRGAGLAGGACSSSHPNLGSDGNCYANCPSGLISPNNNAVCYGPCNFWNGADFVTYCTYNNYARAGPYSNNENCLDDDPPNAYRYVYDPTYGCQS
jgi:hypothetical protein